MERKKDISKWIPKSYLFPSVNVSYISGTTAGRVCGYVFDLPIYGKEFRNKD